MNDVAIRIEGLSKRYRIGELKYYKALRDTLTDMLYAPFRAAASILKRPSNTVSQDNFIWALKDISFDVKRGKAIGIIGRNGAGKSTLLKVLSRITEPTAGNAEVHGRVGSLLEVGTGFHPELTGRENIYLNGAIMGMKKAEIEHKFDEIVAFAEVERFIDTPVKHFSSGMYIRLAFAVAAHLEPEILMVDEVLAVGDAAFQKKCLGKMGDISGEGRTVLFVSHNMGAIKQLCQRAILLNNGMVEHSGPTGEVVARYLEGERGAEAAEYVWSGKDAPGDESARLKAIRLCSGSGEPRSAFGTDEPVYVEVEYTILKRVSPFRVGFSLHGSDGSYIFYSSDDDKREHAGQPRAPGEYVSRCRIPENWLNVGGYFVHIVGGIFGVRQIFKGPRLDFTVISSGGATSRFGERRRGILCPTLDWEVGNRVSGQTEFKDSKRFRNEEI
jgi:lipopolysaccharide transport system ATP-binding protein